MSNWAGWDKSGIEKNQKSKWGGIYSASKERKDSELKDDDALKRDETLSYDQTFTIVRSVSPEWAEKGSGKRFSKYQLETEMRAVKGITIVRTEAKTVVKMGEDKEKFIITIRFKTKGRSPILFMRKYIFPEFGKLKKYGLVKFAPLGRPTPYHPSGVSD